MAGGEVDCSLAEAQAAPYPALSSFHAATNEWATQVASTDGTPKRVEWALVSEATRGESIFDEAVEAARAGGRVCILRNTVRDAIETVRYLEERAPGLLWRPRGADRTPAYHSRFTAADRKILDASVLEDFGKASTREGVILVSTQVVEQSLDVDFDWMMTDLAPVDVLLQRIGRLHRHDRVRPSLVASPRVLVHAPQEAIPPRPELGNLGFGWGTVYKEATDLELTRRLIEDKAKIVIPRDNRGLVEAVYHPEARERLAAEGPEWTSAVLAAEGRGFAEGTAGEMSAVAFDEGYSHQTVQFDAARQDRIRTRLGDDRITVRLDRPVSGWYARTETADDVAVRVDQLVRADGVDLKDPVGVFEAESPDGPLYRVGERLLLRYTPVGWTARLTPSSRIRSG